MNDLINEHIHAFVVAKGLIILTFCSRGVYNGQKNGESAANMSKSFIFANVNERIGLECQKSSAVQKLPIA